MDGHDMDRKRPMALQLIDNPDGLSSLAVATEKTSRLVSDVSHENVFISKFMQR